MSATHTHYFVVSFNSKDNTWQWDTEAEELQFPDGTVVHNESNEWGYAYLGDGEYIDNEDELSEALGKAIKILNEK